MYKWIKSSLGSEEMTLRVLHFVGGWYPTELNMISGNFFREHARAVGLYHEVLVLCVYSVPLRLWLRQFSVYSDKIEYGLRTIRLRLPRLPGWQLLYLFVSILALVRSIRVFNANIVHAHGIFPIGALAILVGGMTHVPVVASAHTNPLESLMHPFWRAWLVRTVFDKAKAILLTSVFSYSQAVALKQTEKYHIVPNTVNTDLFLSPCSVSRSRIKKILYVGRLSSEKGIAFLLNVAVQMKKERGSGFVIDIVGGGPQEKELVALSEMLQLENIAIFHGEKSNIEVAKIMQECDFLVLPSQSENQSVVLLEAMVCGKPVLANCVGGIPEIVNDGCGLLVDTDKKSWVEGLRWMLDNYDNFDSARIASEARTRFSYQAVGDQISEIYTQVLSL